MKTMLVRPAVETNARYSKPVESLGLAYIAGALREAGYEATQLDAMLDHSSTEETIENIMVEGPDILAFTVVFNYFPDEIGQIASAIKTKNSDTVVIVGGHASSFFPENILKHYSEIDAVIVGEGEQAIIAVAEAVRIGAPLEGLNGIVVRNAEGKPIKSHPKRIVKLNTLPRPSRDLVPQLLERDGLICLSTSRGCYARCTFCSIPRFYGLETGKRHASGAWLSRDEKDCVDEIEDLHNRFGLLELLVVDDEFFGGTTFGRDRAFRFAELLAARQLPTRLAISCRAENVEPEIMEMLACAGVAHVFVGVETGVANELKMYGKKHSADQNTRAAQIIKDKGMSFQAGYMLFNHRSTLQTLRDSLEYLRQIGECKPWAIGSAVEPHFGTPLADLMEREGGARIGELSMSSSYPDPQTQLASDLISQIYVFFIPFQEAIQRMQSSITVEWRRSVCGRSEATKAALADMETKIHVACSNLVQEALNLVGENIAFDTASDVIAARLKSIQLDLQRTVGLVAMRLKHEEGEVRYYTQLDLIRERMALTGTYHPGLEGLLA